MLLLRKFRAKCQDFTVQLTSLRTATIGECNHVMSRADRSRPVGNTRHHFNLNVSENLHGGRGCDVRQILCRGIGPPQV